MAGPKSLPFDRVRVIATADAGAGALADRRRTGLAPRHFLERPLRETRLENAASTPAGSRRPAAPGAGLAQAIGEPAADSPGEAAAGLPDSAAPAALLLGEAPRREPPEPAVHEREAEHWPDDEPDPEPDGEPGSTGPAGASRHGEPVQAVARTSGPVAAIARAVEESALIHALAELLRDTCSDESWRETGPWEFTLQLNTLGLGASVVDLHLSRELLSLRFKCRGPGVARVLSRHKETLMVMLQQELPGPLEIEITVDDV